MPTVGNPAAELVERIPAVGWFKGNEIIRQADSGIRLQLVNGFVGEPVGAGQVMADPERFDQ